MGGESEALAVFAPTAVSSGLSSPTAARVGDFWGDSRLLLLLEQTPPIQPSVPCRPLWFPPSSLLIQLLRVPTFESLFVFQNIHLSTKRNKEARIQQKYTF